MSLADWKCAVYLALHELAGDASGGALDDDTGSSTADADGVVEVSIINRDPPFAERVSIAV